jgi:hypothetical protein
LPPVFVLAFDGVTTTDAILQLLAIAVDAMGDEP